MSWLFASGGASTSALFGQGKKKKTKMPRAGNLEGAGRSVERQAWRNPPQSAVDFMS